MADPATAITPTPSPAQVIELLKVTLKERDATLVALKTKTKAFVEEMRAGARAKEEECAALRAQLQQAIVQPLQPPQQQQQQHPGEEGSEGSKKAERRLGNLEEELKLTKEQHGMVLGELAGKAKEVEGLHQALGEAKAALTAQQAQQDATAAAELQALRQELSEAKAALETQQQAAAPAAGNAGDAAVGDLLDFNFGGDRASPVPPSIAATPDGARTSVSPMTALFSQRPAPPPPSAPTASLPDKNEEDELAQLRRKLEETQASLQTRAQALDAASAEVARLLQEQEKAAAAVAKLQSELEAQKQKLEQQETHLQGLDGPMQHLKTQLLEREVTVQEKTILLERCQAELVVAKDEREALQLQLTALAQEKNTLTASLETSKAETSELRGSRDRAIQERDQTKEACTTTRAALVALEEASRSHQDQMTSVRREAEETVQRVTSDAATELSGARFQVQEAEKAQQQAEKTATALHAQMEALRRSTEEAAQRVAEMERERGGLVAELQLERENGKERRRQMKQYLETLTKEKQEREAEVATLSEALAAAKREQGMLEESVQALQERLDAQLTTNEAEVLRLQERLQHHEARLNEVVMDKDAEIARLREEQESRLSTTTRQSEELETHLKAVEAETAAHKQKRIAAKNEMISMAQALEDVTTSSRLVQESMHHTLIPRCLEQLGLLEKAIDQVDAAVWQVTRRGGPVVAGDASNHPSRVRARTGSAGARTGSPGGGVELSCFRLGSTASSKSGKAGAPRSPSGDHLLRGAEEEEGRDRTDSLDSATEIMGHAAGTSDSRARSKSVGAMERLQRLDVETGRVSQGMQALVQGLERLQRGLEAMAEDSLEGSHHAGAHDVASLCHWVLGECFSFVREARATTTGAGNTAGAGAGRRPPRRPYVAVQGHEEEERVIDIV